MYLNQHDNKQQYKTALNKQSYHHGNTVCSDYAVLLPFKSLWSVTFSFFKEINTVQKG